MYPNRNTLPAWPEFTPPPAHRLHGIFSERNLDYYRDALHQGIDLIEHCMASAKKPFSGVTPHELAPLVDAVDLDRPLGRMGEVLAELQDVYLDHAVYFHHPRYVAHLNCPIAVPAILAELLLSSINSSVDTWDQSAGATLIEQKLIDWTTRLIGLGGEADGIFTSGGTQSNLMALLLARDAYCRNHGGGHHAKHQGLPVDFHTLRIFCSQASHFSIQKAAAVLGLGYQAVVPVACDRYFQMDVATLEQAVAGCLEQGLKPMAVVATAGTTDFGSIDPLPEIAALCQTRQLWLHVDAAYGCGLLVSRKFRHLLDGIQQADSVTVDYHKSFLQPVSCSAFLAKNRRDFSAVTYHADYLNPLSQAGNGIPNLVDKSLQTTRRFDALKLWLTLRILGADKLGEAFDRCLHLAKQTYLLLLSEPHIEVLHQPRLSTLVFRYCAPGKLPDSRLDEVNVHIRQALFRSGEAVVAGTKVHGRQYLKFTLLNPAATIQDMQAILGLIKQHGQRYLGMPGEAHAAANQDSIQERCHV